MPASPTSPQQSTADERPAVVESCRTDDRIPVPGGAADSAANASSNSLSTTTPTTSTRAAVAGSSSVVDATCDSSAIDSACVVAGAMAIDATAPNVAAGESSTAPAATQRVTVELNNVTATADSSSVDEATPVAVPVAAVISSSDSEKQSASDSEARQAAIAAQAAQDLEEEETARFWRNHQFKGARLRGGLSSTSALASKPATASNVMPCAPTIVFESSAPQPPKQQTTADASPFDDGVASVGSLAAGSAKHVQYVDVKQPERPPSVSSDDGSVSDLVIDESPREDVVEERVKSDSIRVADDGAESSAKRLYDRHNGISSKENGVANEVGTPSPWMLSQQQLPSSARLQPPPLLVSSASADTAAAMSSTPVGNPAAVQRKHSMYVQNPDFSKHSSSHSSSNSAKDLSSLHMKPPDFSKICQNYSANNNDSKLAGQPEQTASSGVHSGNFAEISKQRNYISDLQLKTPSPTKPIQTTTPSPPIGMHQPQQSAAANPSASNSRSYNYPLIKAPDFSKSTKNFAPVPSSVLDEHRSNNIQKTPAIAPPAKQAPTQIHANRTLEAIPTPAIVYKTFPQISQDVTMSIVPNQQPTPAQHAHQQQLPQLPQLHQAPSQESTFPTLKSSSRPQYMPFNASGPSTVPSLPPPLKHTAPYQSYPDQHALPPRKLDSYRNQPILEMTNPYGNRIPDPYAGREPPPHNAQMHYQPSKHLTSEPGPSSHPLQDQPPQATNDQHNPAQAYQPGKQPHAPSTSTSSIPTTPSASSSAHPSSRPFAHNMPENYVKQNSSYIPRNEDPGTYYEASTSKPHPLPGHSGHPQQQQQSPLQQQSSALNRGQQYAIGQQYPQQHPTHPMHMQNHQTFPPIHPAYGGPQPAATSTPAAGPSEHKSRARTKTHMPSTSAASDLPGPMNPPLSWHGPGPTSNNTANHSSGSNSYGSNNYGSHSYDNNANNNDRTSRSPQSGVHTTSPHYPLQQGFDPSIHANPSTSPYQSYSSNPSATKQMSHIPPMLSLFNPASTPYGHPTMTPPSQSNTVQPTNSPFFAPPELQYHGHPENATKQLAGNAKRMDFVDLTKSTIPTQRQPSAAMGSSTKPGSSRNATGTGSNRSDKPAYATNTNTIMDPFVFRQSSEDALNIEIIKKTLNKDARRVDVDMGRNQMPGPSSQYKSSMGSGIASTSNASYSHLPSRVQQSSQQQQPIHPPNQRPPPSQQPPMQPSQMPAELNHRHDLTVIPSRALAPSAAAVSRSAPTNDASFHSSMQSVQHYQYYPQPLPNAAVGPLVIKNESNSGPAVPVQVAPPPMQPSTSRPVHLAAAPSQPPPNIRRDTHPLDLSVKTVKTKADSTGCENYSSSSSAGASPSPMVAGCTAAGVFTPPTLQARPFSVVAQPPSLKVEFAPNFYAHSNPSSAQRSMAAENQQQQHVPMSNNGAASGQPFAMMPQPQSGQSALHRSTSAEPTPLAPPPVARKNYLQPQQQEQLQQQQLQHQQLMKSYSQEQQYQLMYEHPPLQHNPPHPVQKPMQLPNRPHENASFESSSSSKDRKSASRSSKASPALAKTSTPPVKSFVLNPSVPTVFGAKPEELKNLPVIETMQNPDVHRNTTAATNSNAYSSYGSRTDPSQINANISQHPAAIRRPNDHLRYLQPDPNARTAGPEPPPSSMPAPLLQSVPPPLAQLSQRRTEPPANVNNAAQFNPRIPPMTSAPSTGYVFNSHPGAGYPTAHPNAAAAVPTPQTITLQSSQQPQADLKRMASAPFELHTEAKRERRESPMPPISSQYPNHNAAYRAESMASQQQQQQPQQHQQRHLNNMPPYEDYHRSSILHGTSDVFISQPHTTRLDDAGQVRPLNDTKLLQPPPMHDVKQQHSNRQYYSAPTQQTWYPPATEQWPPPAAGRNAPATVPSVPPHPPPPELVVQQRPTVNHRSQTVQQPPQMHYPFPSVPLANHSTAVGPSAQSVYRGADKGVITKLRTNLELKEQQKLRHSSGGVDVGNHGNMSNGQSTDTADQKSDMASLIAARIRTKGELKGFTPIPVTPVQNVATVKAAEIAVDPSVLALKDEIVSVESTTATTVAIQPMPSTSSASTEDPATFEDRLKAEFAEFSNVSLNVELNDFPTRDLMNWGSACDGFQQQLQTGANSTAAAGSGSTSSTLSPTKRARARASRGGRRQSTSQSLFASGDDVLDPIRAADLPGSDYKCSIDPDVLVDVIAGERKLAGATTAAAPASASKTLRSSDSSSDEDTPLGVLRQQSLNEAKIRSEVEGMCKVMPTVASVDAIEQLDPVSKEQQVRVKKEQQRVKREQEKKLAIASSSSDEDAPSPKSPQQRGQRTKKMVRKRLPKAQKTGKPESSGRRQDESSVEQSTDVGTERSKTAKRIKLQLQDGASTDNSEPSVVRRTASKMESDTKAASADEHKLKSDTANKLSENSKLAVEEAVESADGTENSDSEEDSKPRTRKIAVIQETMTRSKRKLEEEQLKANSKVLRNEKVIKNVITSVERKEKSPLKSKLLNKVKDETSDKSATTTPTRRGSARKAAPTVGSDSDVSDDEPQTSSRLRSRLSKSISESTPTTPAVDKVGAKVGTSATDKPTSKKTTKAARQNSTVTAANSKDTKSAVVVKQNSYPIGWEQQAYEFKRSLKIPASLITIGRPGSNHAKPSSLPDLDPQHSSDTSELFSEHKRRLLESQATAAALAAIADPKKESANRRGRPAKIKADPDAKEVPIPPDTVEDAAAIASPSKSIIDLLHQRVIRPTNTFKPVRSKFRVFSNEPKILRQSNVTELLPTPGVDDDSAFPKSLNVFETPVLKSRTRKEHLAQQSQDILRNVFGCADGDRPASAPPMNCDLSSVAATTSANAIKSEPNADDAANASDGAADDANKLPTMYTTFDQKYQQYLEKMMNFDFGEKIRKQRGPRIVVSTPATPTPRPTEATTTSTHASDTPPPLLQSIKLERMDVDDDADESQDTLLSECIRIKEEGADDDDDMDDDGEAASDRGTPSVMSAMSAEERDGRTPNSFGSAFRPSGGSSSGKVKGGGRGHRSGRRKGSSGFDYIRKKKKATTLLNADGTPVAQPKVPRRAAAINYLEVKTEADIGREIRGWVLQKGLGESVLHKAARLGYMDVIAYCVERLDMSPNQKDNAGYTPLHEACSRGSLDIAKLLLRYGANHSDTAHAGKRPLHEAVENGYVEIVRLLLAYGADPLLATYGGE